MSWKKRLTVFLALAVLAIPFFAQAEKGEVKIKAPAATVARVKRVYTQRLTENGFKPEDLDVVAMGQSHIDAAWLWRWKQTRDYKCPKTFKSALLHFRQFPGFTYHQSAPQYYEWIKDTKPEMWRQIVEAEKRGDWILVGGMWVEPDCNMPEGESFVRQNLYGQRFFLENFGHISDVSWLLDSFGYNWNLPQIVAKSGQKYMWTNKLTWNTHNIFPFHTFWWQSPDGTKVLTHITPAVGGPSFFPFVELESSGAKDFLLTPVGSEGVNFSRNKYRETRYLLKSGESLTANYLTPPANIVSKLSNDFMGVVGIFYGVGDGGHGPIRTEIEQQEAMKQLGFARIGTADELFGKLEKYSDRMPTWNDEMYLEYHQGVMTTHEWIKRANRGAEAILRSAEAAASAAFLLGDQYPAAELLNSWKLALLNQFHDILPGSSIPEVYEDAKVHYTEIQNDSQKLIDGRIDFLAGKVKMSPPEGGRPVMVYNPLGWARSDVVKLAINAGEKFQVFTEAGRELPSQAARSESGGDYLYFVPDSLPALGWKVFYLKNGESKLAGPAVKEEGNLITVENDLVKIAVCRKSGLLVSLYDKRLNREFIKRPSNKLLAFIDQPKDYPAWNIADNYLTRPIDTPAATSVTVQAKGPAFARILVERKAEPTSFKQWITVYSGSPLVEMITYTDMHWKETLVKLEFNTAVETGKVAADIPYAVIERSTHPTVEWDKARTEMPVQKWSDLSDKNSGIALINFGKYGFSMNEDGTGWRLSIVKAAKFPKPRLGDRGVNVIYETLATLHTDQGDHWAQTALFPHKGGWQQGAVSKAAYEYNTPAIARKVSAGNGSLPAEASILTLDSPAGAYIASVKKAEDDDGLVVRVVGESADTSAVLKVNPRFQITGAAETDLLEFNPEPLKHDTNSVAFPVGHFEIKTIKLKLAR